MKSVVLAPMQSFLEHPHGRGGRRQEFVRRPDRAPLEVAAAVGADPVQAVFRARGAPRALEGADDGIGRGRRKVDVAALAAGAQFEHGGIVRLVRRPPVA